MSRTAAHESTAWTQQSIRGSTSAPAWTNPSAARKPCRHDNPIRGAAAGSRPKAAWNQRQHVNPVRGQDAEKPIKSHKYKGTGRKEQRPAAGGTQPPSDSPIVAPPAPPRRRHLATTPLAAGPPRLAPRTGARSRGAIARRSLPHQALSAPRARKTIDIPLYKKLCAPARGLRAHWGIRASSNCRARKSVSCFRAVVSWCSSLSRPLRAACGRSVRGKR